MLHLDFNLQMHLEFQKLFHFHFDSDQNLHLKFKNAFQLHFSMILIDFYI